MANRRTRTRDLQRDSWHVNHHHVPRLLSGAEEGFAHRIVLRLNLRAAIRHQKLGPVET